MKTFYVTLISLGLSIFCSCNEKEYIQNSGSPTQYLIALEAVDGNGRNVMVDVPLSQIKGAAGEAWYTVEKIKLKNSVSIVNRLAEDNVNYLVLCVDGGDFNENPEGVTWKIKCKELYGDQETYTIESDWWKRRNDRIMCTHITFEGVRYRTELKNGYWTARVVVKR